MGYSDSMNTAVKWVNGLEKLSSGDYGQDLTKTRGRISEVGGAKYLALQVREFRLMGLKEVRDEQVPSSIRLFVMASGSPQ